MRRIGIILKDGGIELETQGFQGEACLKEVEELIKQLEALGLDVDTTSTEPTGEYYVVEQVKVKSKA